MAPAFYDEGTHIVVAHRVNFDILKMINDIDIVDRIRGTYAGGGMASIAPFMKNRTKTLLDNTVTN